MYCCPSAALDTCLQIPTRAPNLPSQQHVSTLPEQQTPFSHLGGTLCVFILENNDRMPLKYLITGATGHLGRETCRYMIENVPKSTVGAASSNPSNRAKFESLGIEFRHLDYDDPQALEVGLRDVENLLFVSTGSNRRGEQHGNVINAAKKANVEHVCLPWLSIVPDAVEGIGLINPRCGTHLLSMEATPTSPR